MSGLLTKRRLAVLIALMAGLRGTIMPALASPDSAETQVVRGNTAFALDLYARERAAGGNLFFSPYSISTALAMTYTGARGATAGEMAKVLRFGVAPDK